MLLKKSQRCFVGKIQRKIWINLAFQVHEPSNPVTSKKCEIWEALMHSPSAKTQQNRAQLHEIYSKRIILEIQK